MTEGTIHLVLALAFLYVCRDRVDAQGALHMARVVQLCFEYSDAGDLLEARVSACAFGISIARPSGQIVELNGSIPDVVSTSAPARLILPCQIAISASSNRAALAIPTASGLFLQLVNLSKGKLTQTVRVPPIFPIQFSLHPLGFVDKSEQIAVAQAHYLSNGDPEVSTQLIGPAGTITPDAHSVLGPAYTEVSGASFDFRGGDYGFCAARILQGLTASRAVRSRLRYCANPLHLL